VRRVLLVRPRFIGDVCLTLPALDAARAVCPGARFAYVLERSCAPLLEGDPRVDELIVTEPRGGGGAGVALAARLRRFAPDVAIDFFCNPRTALWTFLSGARRASAIPTRVGAPRSTPTIRGRARSRPPASTSPRWPRWAGPRVPPRRGSTSAPRHAPRRRASWALGVPSSARCVGFHPGARWMTRRWDPANFVALAERLLAHDREGFALVTGRPGRGSSGRERDRRARSRRARAVVGWPLARFVALQARCRAFVCGDTGPLHTAVAAGTPTLGPHVSQPPGHVLPLSGIRRPSRILRARRVQPLPPRRVRRPALL
jgi:ADP-heptose:LPS heptosyltransferase